VTDEFTAVEERALRESLSTDHSPECPRCGRPMDLMDIPPRPEVAYVRVRAILQCGTCHLKCVVDGTRGP
jgi:hypothetical protein